MSKIFSFLKKRHLIIPIVLFILIIPSFSFLLTRDYYNMHDDMQMIRQLEFEKCLKDGQIPCRWTPDLGYGYGYPLFNFYPPLPYMVGQIFRTIGFSFMTSIKLTAVLQFILAGFFMYILAKSIFGRIGGMISALFYTYAPYHAVDIYVRGAMNEAWSLVFFPLIFYFSRQSIICSKIKNYIGLSLSLAGLFLSHNPMVLTIAPFLAFWIVINIVLEKKPIFSQLLKLFLSAVLSLSLVAFFTVPLLLESKYTHVNSMFTGYYSYDIHFTSLNQLFISNFWGDGPSVWGPEDGMSFSVGYLHWLIPLILLILTVIYFYKNKKMSKTLFLFLCITLMGLFAVFMTHNKSTFIWQMFPQIQKIQFPWRFLNHVIFLLSLGVGCAALYLKKLRSFKIRNLIIFLVISSLLWLNLPHFTPITHGPLTDDQKFSGLAWNNQITSGIYDYLPLTASQAAKSAAKPFIDTIQPESQYQLSGGKQGSDWMSFNLSLKEDSQVVLSVLAFPKFKVTDNNNEIPYNIENDFGRIVLNLKSGDHQVFVQFVNTPVRTFSNYLSLLSWVALFIYLSKPLWSKLIFRK